MPETTETKTLQFRRVRSSQIDQLAHDPETCRLLHQIPRNVDVLLSEFHALLDAESIGVAFNTRIKKGGFEYQKLNPEDPAWQCVLPADQVDAN